MVKVLDIDVGSTGYGLMSFNITPASKLEDAIPVMKHALESGARFWSAAEFYGTPEYNSLHLIAAYFTRYPQDVNKVVISVKVGLDPITRKLATDEASVRKSYETCAKILGGIKKIDIFSCARVDPEVPVEVSIRTLAAMVKEGKIGGVGVSECSATTLRRAASCCKIETVEVEVSMFTPDIFANGVATAAAEVGAVIVAYSPLGRGLLTGTITGIESLGENDHRRMFPRFEEQSLQNNLKLVKGVDGIAQRLDATKGQVALAWVRARSDGTSLPQILPIPGTKSTKRLDENMKEVNLSDGDLKDLDTLIAENPAMGDRYFGPFAKLQWG